ncbi:Component of the cap-binding complex (CBC) [Periplaneta americana]|uniref:Component of the cap-binding complex (CBC) n=1 Tax=Periplaneta americana TaxID=6978 RepID=A0ABQ8U1A1_PERAM|nr:Component of the cap-binding complex (CBC) [Periplaneta americana]
MSKERAYRKRRRVSENQEIEDRLESLILRVGEKSTSSLESNLEGLASVLEADLATFRSKILRILTDCAIKMPEKCTIYTTLVGLLNAKNYNFGGEFVEYMVRNLKDSLKACKWDAARYSLRFLADLVNCHVISAGSLLQLLDNMVDAAKEDGVPQVRKDWYVFAVLSTLPWVGRELYEKKEQALEHLLVSIEVFLGKRSKKHHAALRVWALDTPHPQEEYLDCLWAQIRKLRQDNWAEKHIPRPYLAFDSILCEALQHNLPTILPPPHHDGYQYPMPHVVFRMFDYTDCPEGPILPGAHSVERFLIEEHLHQIIEMHHLERKDWACCYNSDACVEPVDRRGFVRRDERVLEPRNMIAMTDYTASSTVLSRQSTTMGVDLSASMVRRHLLRAGLVAHMPLRRLPLSRNHQCLRLQWVRECRHWHAEWQNVVFSDEFRFNLSYNDGHIHVKHYYDEHNLRACIVELHSGQTPSAMV